MMRTAVTIDPKDLQPHLGTQRDTGEFQVHLTGSPSTSRVFPSDIVTYTTAAAWWEFVARCVEFGGQLERRQQVVDAAEVQRVSAARRLLDTAFTRPLAEVAAPDDAPPPSEVQPAGTVPPTVPATTAPTEDAA